MDDISEENGRTELVPIEEMSLDELQMAEQLYTNAGLDPVVNAGLKDYDLKIKQENKLLNKVLGPRESDIRGYGESVARRVAYAVYALMNRQYGGKVGDLREYIMTLQDERDRANTRYDDLMGRVVGILGEEYRNLRTDSNMFMEKVADVLGEGFKESKIDYTELAGRLADIDGLRNQVISLAKEKEELRKDYEEQLKQKQENHDTVIAEQKTVHDTSLEDQKNSYETQLENQKADYESRLAAQTQDYESKFEKQKTAYKSSREGQKNDYESKLAVQKQDYESQLTVQKQNYESASAKQAEEYKVATEKLNADHKKQVGELNARISALEEQVRKLEADGVEKAGEITRLSTNYARLEEAVLDMNEIVSLDEINAKFGEELHAFVLEDSKIPDMVIDGVGKFIDFRKYFGLAAEKGAQSALKSIETGLRKVIKKNKA
ncbi:MAG: hypothetical protein JW712_08300 [Dehalococcoidales bacterium]|nr:hypothetical protein [Dehalococcoidales bacterium]